MTRASAHLGNVLPEVNLDQSYEPQKRTKKTSDVAPTGIYSQAALFFTHAHILFDSIFYKSEGDDTIRITVVAHDRYFYSIKSYLLGYQSYTDLF